MDWKSRPWSPSFPGDFTQIGDTVVDRSICIAEPEHAAEKDVAESPILSSPAVDALLARLDALDAGMKAEGSRIAAARVRVDAVVCGSGLSTRTAPSGLPVVGLFEGGLKADAALLCRVLVFLDPESRGRTRVASPGEQRRLRGTHIVIRDRAKTGYKLAAGVPELEVQPKSLAGVKIGQALPTFLVSKRHVKVVTLKVGEEVFFRPFMMFKEYESAQDWPRGRVLEVRPSDGVVVVQSWSWRLAPASKTEMVGKGATVYAQWTDVRRAPSRTKYQMLPEQRVWRAAELKADATKLFNEAQGDEKAHDEWAAVKTALSSSSSSSSSQGGNGAASAASAATKAATDSAATPTKPAAAAAAAAASAVGGAKKTPSKNGTSKSPAVSAGKKAAVGGGVKGGKAAKAKPPPKPLLNSALLFLKPEVAASTLALAMVKETLASKGLKVVEEGSVGSEVMASEGLVDNHYGAIANKALKQRPHEHVLTAEQRKSFEAKLEVGWFDALSRRVLVNAASAEAEVEGLKAAALKRLKKKKGDADDVADTAAAVEAVKSVSFAELWKSRLEMVKLGGGFYVGKVQLPASLSPPKQCSTYYSTSLGQQGGGGGGVATVLSTDQPSTEPVFRYVVNGFYMSMREPFLKPSAQVHVMVVEWQGPLLGPNAAAAAPAPTTPGKDSIEASSSGGAVASSVEPPLSWVQFREDVIGATDPASAKEGSLRRKLFDEWESLGLAAQPFVSANGVHGSASPLEALFEKANWLKAARASSSSSSPSSASSPSSSNPPPAASQKKFSWSADPFGLALLGGSLSESTLDRWMEQGDPLVRFDDSGSDGGDSNGSDGGGGSGGSGNPLNGAGRQALRSLFDLVEGMDATVCRAKCRAIACDPLAKLEAAKKKYREAVDYVEGGDEIADPDNVANPKDLKRGSKPPCAIVQAGIAEGKATTYSAMAMCCSKIVKRLDSSGGANTSLAVRKAYVKEMEDRGLAASKVLEELSLSSAKTRPVVKELTKRHSKTKLFGHMRCKALYYVALGKCEEGEFASGLVFTAKCRELHAQYAEGSAAMFLTSKEPSLKKLMDAQHREVLLLHRRCAEGKKAQANKDNKFWGGALKKNESDPEAGLPPPKDPKEVAAAEAAAQQQALQQQLQQQQLLQQQAIAAGMAAGGGLLPGGMAPMGADGGLPGLNLPSVGAAGVPHPGIREVAPRNEKRADDSGGADADDEEEAVDTQEVVFGALALGAVATIGYLGYKMFSRSRR